MKTYITQKPKFQTAERMAFYFFMVITVTWFFFFIGKGIDITDQAYYLARYKYYFDAELNVKNMGTFLTDLLGAGIYKISDSCQAIILSFCSWLLYMGSGVLIYNWIKSYIPNILALVSVFFGSLFSLTWIHIMNYNATSMFILVLSIFLLMRGIEKEEKKWFYMAGFSLGLNTFFRVPNVLQICIGVCILWYFILCKDEAKKGVRNFARYVAGVCGGWIIGGILLFAIIGKKNIFAYVVKTANTASDSQSSHGIGNILWNLYTGAKEGILVWLYVAVPIILFLAVFFVIRLKIEYSKFKIVNYISIVIMICYGSFIGQQLPWQVFCKMLGSGMIIIAFVGIFYFKKRNPIISTASVVLFCTEFVLCIGTDNAWNYHLVFMMVPFSIFILIAWNAQDIRISKEVKLGLLCLAVMTFVVGSTFAVQYVYRDEANENLQYTISAREYKGIETSKERSEYLNCLVEEMDKMDGKYLLAHGDFNIGYVITDKKPFLENIWNDLASYPVDKFETDLENGIQEKGYPIILLADVDKNGVYRNEEKLALIEQVLEEGTYKCSYENEWYKIYIPAM